MVKIVDKDRYKIIRIFFDFSKTMKTHKLSIIFLFKQGRKRPLDTPKRMRERRKRDGERERER